MPRGVSWPLGSTGILFLRKGSISSILIAASEVMSGQDHLTSYLLVFIFGAMYAYVKIKADVSRLTQHLQELQNSFSVPPTGKYYWFRAVVLSIILIKLIGNSQQGLLGTL
jgi:hypothetical protein